MKKARTLKPSVTYEYVLVQQNDGYTEVYLI